MYVKLAHCSSASQGIRNDNNIPSVVFPFLSCRCFQAIRVNTGALVADPGSVSSWCYGITSLSAAYFKQ